MWENENVTSRSVSPWKAFIDDWRARGGTGRGSPPFLSCSLSERPAWDTPEGSKNRVYEYLMNELHLKAKALAKTYKTTERELLGVLIEMQEKSLFLPLGYKHLFDYADRGLGLGESQAGYFNRVAQKSREVPQLKAAITSGEITLSQGRRLLPVITKENAPI